MDKHTLTGIIDRFEGDFAVIKLGTGQEVNWPRQKLPAELKEGSAVKLKIMTSVEEDQERTSLARTLLNEIFKTSQ